MIRLTRFQNLSDANGVEHFVTTREGGTSQGDYASLNLGLHVSDESQSVLENRRRLAEATGIHLDRFVFMRQTHGVDVAVVEEKDRGRGSGDYESGIPADAMVTNVPSVPLMVLVADCVPVLLYDPRQQVVGVAHAGWKGVAGNIVGRTVEVMSDRFGTKPGDVVAGIGPSIGPCHYSKPEAKKHLAKFMDGDRLDLWAAVESQLKEAGVQNLESSRVCTFEQSETYFSHRHDGPLTGRFAGGIALT